MKILFGALGTALVIVLGIGGWMGALTPIRVEERDLGPYRFVYVQEASTNPKKVGELTHALGERLEAAGIALRKPAQEYYPPGRGLQNQIGFLVEQPVDLKVLGAEAFFREVPVQRYMVVEFPFRNRLSFMVGAMRVEGAFRKYMAARKYAETSAMVILDGNHILYLEPIAPA